MVSILTETGHRRQVTGEAFCKSGRSPQSPTPSSGEGEQILIVLPPWRGLRREPRARLRIVGMSKRRVLPLLVPERAQVLGIAQALLGVIGYALIRQVRGVRYDDPVGI